MSLLQEKLLELEFIHDDGVTEYISKKYNSYHDILNVSSKYSDLLRHLEQEVVTVILPNSIDYLEIMIACHLSGNIFNPIPFFTSSDEVKRICDYIKPKIVFTTNLELIDKLKDEHVIDVGSYEGEQGEVLYKKLDEDAIASLYYSSGTTGNPKGVLYSHANVFSLIKSIIKGFGFDSQTKHLSLLPFGHTASINYNIFPCLFNHSPLIIAESFSAIAPFFFKILAEEKINYTQLVPTVVLMLMKIKYDVSNLSLDNLMFIGCGSSILPKESQDKFESLYSIRISNLYGLSETGPSHIDDPRLTNWESGSIGIPLDVNECKLSDDNELMLKGKNVFVGYYKNDKLYAETVVDDWFATGDIIEYKKGKYYYLDRKKDIIIKGGINIVPAEVEEILYKHDSVHEAVVVGILSEIHGEEVIAAVTKKENTVSDEKFIADLYDLLSQHLSSYKHPRNIYIMESIPKTHSGKLLRRGIKELFLNDYN